MQASTGRSVAGTLLCFTGALGLVILSTDKILWGTAPLHGYALIIFVILDFVMASVVFAKPSELTFTLAAAWSGLRIVLQIGDIFLAPSFQLTYAQFADYLFNPTLTSPPNPTGVPGALIDLTVILEVIIVIVAIALRSSTNPTVQQ